MDVYIIVDCDWEKARTAVALNFLPFVEPGQTYVMWTGSVGIDPVVNPPNGLGLTNRDTVLQIIDNDLRPQICSQNNFQQNQISTALGRLITEQQNRNTPFIVDIFTSRPENYFNERELQNYLNQIRTMQQGRGMTYVAYGGQGIPQVLERLQSQSLLTVNSVFSSTLYADIISSTICSQLQSALG